MKTAKRLSMVTAVALSSMFIFAALTIAAEKRAIPAPSVSPDKPVTAQTRAWLHGIPGDTTPGGIPVAITSHPAHRRVQLTMKGNENAMLKIKALREKRARVNLKLVVRQNPGDKQDIVYDLGDATIESIQGDASQASFINMVFGRMSQASGVSMNPGVPPAAPAIDSTGINKGWVHFAETKDPNGVPVDVISYTSPEATGEMKLTFEGSDALIGKLKELAAHAKPVDMLILMLPDRENNRYIEYKLARASINVINDDKDLGRYEVVFSSDEIECYTGENEKHSEK